ncbi:hypothetical protein Scep_028361 [Stephania cephalantha]|uniref:Uncharacterized protein n=1 Tax=Stephania cephalantha TaxID=152367 RepID=A0AAP0HJI2_9MAGN
MGQGTPALCSPRGGARGKISLLEECELFDKALEELQKKEAKIVDRLAFKEQRNFLISEAWRLEEGERIYKALRP